MSLKDLIEWLTAFVGYLNNPPFLIFFCALVVGWVIKNTKIPIPNWIIPSLLAAIGLLSGAILLGTGWPGRFNGALMGMTLALAATGFHQVFSQYFEQKQKASNENPDPPVSH